MDPVDDPQPADPKLHALALRSLAQLDAWKALALARGEILADALGLDKKRALAAQHKAAAAVLRLERLGINPNTGRPLPAPKPAKKAGSKPAPQRITKAPR